MKRGGGYVFCQKWWVKGKGVGPRGRASMYKALSRTPRFFPLEKKFRHNHKSRPELYTEILELSVLRGQDAPWYYVHLKEFAYTLKIRDLTPNHTDR